MKNFIFIILILCSIHFWGFAAIPDSFHTYTDFFSLLILGYGFLRVFHMRHLQFRYPIMLLLLGIIINIIAANINHNQSIRDTFLTSTYFYFILFYFYLHDSQITHRALENIVIVFAAIYSIFYLIQMAVYPNQIFDTSMLVNRGTIRLRIQGNGFLMLAYFLLLNRYLVNYKIQDLLVAFGFFIILLIGGFRTLTIVSLVLSGHMYLKLSRGSININSYILLVLFFAFIIFLFEFEKTSNIIDEMYKAARHEIQAGDKNIRMIEADYFFRKFPVNKSVYFFGSGLPGSTSTYSQYMNYLARNYGLFWVDLGYFGFYIIVGLIALIGLLWYTIKAIFAKLDTDKLYLNYYFTFLFLVSFSTMEIFRPGIFIVEAIGLYLIDKNIANK